MAIPHASAGEIVDLHARPNGAQPGLSTVLVKTPTLEVLRLVMPAGKEIPPHRARGEITVHCLKGRISFQAYGRTQELTPGQLLYLEANAEHALQAHEASVVLVTLLLLK